uniref:Protein kinase domain-containing protein n=1 Tax=Arcella intermedia TaxID=1963864 RepID=A0A6B2L2W3_9EUKA
MENEKEGFPITAIREIKILKELNHENVIKLLEIVIGTDEASKGSVYLVFEFMDHDMAGLMDSAAGTQITEEQIKCYFKQLLEGLFYLHKNNILHRDIKASNLLINNNGILKLADFGLARPISESEQGKYTNKVITLWYRPPELLLGAEQYGAAVDMWSAGCILAELLSPKKEPLFQGKTEPSQLELIFMMLGTPSDDLWPEGRLLPWWKNMKPKVQSKSKLREKHPDCSEHALDLLEKLLSLDPKQRMSASEALDHKYFWTEPFPCDPRKIPNFPSCHEYTTKKRKQRVHEQQKNLSGLGSGSGGVGNASGPLKRMKVDQDSTAGRYPYAQNQAQVPPALPGNYNRNPYNNRRPNNANRYDLDSSFQGSVRGNGPPERRSSTGSDFGGGGSSRPLHTRGGYGSSGVPAAPAASVPPPPPANPPPRPPHASGPPPKGPAMRGTRGQI